MLGKKKKKIIWKTIPTTIFIQLLRTKTIKRNKKTNIVKKNKKKEKSYLNVVASEAKKRKKNKFVKYIN